MPEQGEWPANWAHTASCLRTGFNDFDRATLVEVRDPAMLETAGYALRKEFAA